MHRTLTVLAVVFIAIAKMACGSDEVGTGSNAELGTISKPETGTESNTEIGTANNTETDTGSGGDIGSTGNRTVSNCNTQDSVVKSLRLFMLGITPKCNKEGHLLPKQCFEHSNHCVCIRPDGTVINKPTKGLKACKCMVENDEVENSGMIGGYAPQCEADGTYSKLQCHYSIGMCYCADPSTGKNTTALARYNVNCN